MAAEIAARVSQGRRFPDGGACQRSAVVYFEMEDRKASTTVPRLEAAGADMDTIILGPQCNLGRDIAPLTAIVARTGARLVVISPLRSFFSEEDCRTEERLRKTLEPLLMWMEEADVCVLGVTHPKPGQSGFGGSSVWEKVARAGLFIEAAEGGGIVTPIKSNLASKAGKRLRYRLENTNLGRNIDVARVVWVDSDDGEGGEVQQPPDAQTGGKLAPGDWLRGALARGPRLYDELMAEARGLGHAESTLYRHREKLGVVSEEDAEGRLLWVLHSHSHSHPALETVLAPVSGNGNGNGNGNG
jgi:putative DNA primase/helicase